MERANDPEIRKAGRGFARLARTGSRGYAARMNVLRMTLLAAVLLLTACASQRTTDGTSVPLITQKIESGFFHAGGSLQKFFTGKDTLSEKQ